MRNIIFGPDVRALQGLTQQLEEQLIGVLKHAESSRAEAELVISKTPIPQYYEQHHPSSNLQLDVRLLEAYFTDKKRERSVESSLAIVVDALRAWDSKARALRDKLEQLRLKLDTATTEAHHDDELEQSVACLASFSRWIGRADMALSYRLHRDKLEKIRQDKIKAGKASQRGRDEYFLAVIEDLFLLIEKSSETSIEDLINFNANKIELFNESFCESNKYSYRPPGVLNLAKELKKASKSVKFAEPMKRLKEELERKNKRRRRNR